MGTFEREYRRLNQAQKQAVDTIEGPVLVIAGPGTGKTQLLSMRVANILNQPGGILPQNVLCLTFTESGQRAMRDRLNGLIGQNAYDVTISTYHAFGRELIHRFPEYFSDTPGSQAIDDLGIDAVFRSIFANAPYSNPLKHSKTYLSDLKTLVSDFKRALLTPDDIRKIAMDNETFITAASHEVRTALKPLKRLDAKSAPLFTALAERTRQYKQETATKGIVPLSRLWQEQLEAALHHFEETGKTTELTKWKNAWLAKDAEGQFIADGLHTVHKIRAAATMYEQYLAALELQNLYDYDDMILRAIRGLETHADLRYTLQEQYQYLLLDEFQDTNGAQLRLIELLTDNPVNEGRPNVLAVGDDDQAIYAFQGADYSHMLAFQHMYKDVSVIPLVENYRSHADVLHVAHGIAEQIEERLHHKFEGINKKLVAANKDLPPAARIERHEFKSDVAQYAWVAREIQARIKDGMPPFDIAVLAPKHKYLEPLVPYLSRAGIPLRYDKRENVLDDPAIMELTRMAELVLALNGRDYETADSIWPEVLSFDFWQLPTSLIWQLSWRANDNKLTWTEVLLEDAVLRSIALFFVRLSLVMHTETLETMLDYLVGIEPLDLHEPGVPPFQSPFYSHYFEGLNREATTQEFWSLLSNLTVLRTALRNYKAAEETPLNLQDFIQFTAAHRAADIKILNTSPYHEADSAVQLMTAYKAKGQEYGAVFVLAVLDEVWGGKARNQSSRIPLPPNLQHIRYAGASNDERLRLFFVAITRAKHQLYLTSYLNNYANKPSTRLRFLGETQDENEGLVCQLLPPAARAIRQNDQAAPQVEELAAFWHSRHHDKDRRLELKHLLAPRLDAFQLSPTHVNSFTDVIYGGPQHFFMNTLLRFPKRPSPDGQYGNAIHETLEWVHAQYRQHGKLPAKKAVMTTFEQRLRAKRLAARDTELLMARGRDCLEAYLAQRAGSITADNKCEYSFRHEGILLGNAHLTGNIDKLIIDKAAKTITVVDFKTGKSFNRWISTEAKLHKYRQQLYLYKLLVEGSHSFAGYKVVDAYLEFVEPDQEGAITELHVDFDDQTLKRTRDLAERIWQHIQDLDFPDCSSYSQDLKGIKQFEDDLLSGKI
jgi:DNA helicase-2/ATP-dependent DNA helicase PcrA